MIYEHLQCIGGFIILTGYIKQIRDIYAGASCLGLSLKAYSTVLIGVFLMEFNALNILLKGYGSAFFVTNTITCVIISYLILLIWARQNAEKKQRTIIKDAFFVSVYNNDSVILTPCKVNLNTKEISDIVSAPYVITETLTSECVIIGENEFPAEEAESRQNQDSFWY